VGNKNAPTEGRNTNLFWEKIKKGTIEERKRSAYWVKCRWFEMRRLIFISSYG